MAGAMRKLGLYLGLVEDDDRRDALLRRLRGRVRRGRRVRRPARGGPRRRSVASTPTGASRRCAPAGPTRGSLALDETRAQPVLREQPVSADREYRITTLHPRTYNEARTIGEHFREGTPVIMNLTEMDDADAKRLVDFAAGLIFGLHGSIERVTARVFLLSPADVTVTAEDKQRIVEGGFFNQS